nr:MAG TPA: hypothetical protein [Caudoviricetes sp.]
MISECFRKHEYHLHDSQILAYSTTNVKHFFAKNKFYRKFANKSLLCSLV